MSGEKPPEDPEQLQLDFSGRQWILRRWLMDDTHVKHLLRVLIDHIPRGESDCFLTQSTIAREMSASIDCVKRTVGKAKQMGLVIVFGKKGRRRCNTYRVRFAELVDLARNELGYGPETTVSDMASTPSNGCTAAPSGEGGGGHSRTVMGALPHVDERTTARSSLTGIEQTKNSPPPTPSTGQPHPADEWAAVEGLLIDFGVGDPGPPLERCRSRGCTPSYVRKFVEFARSKVCRVRGTDGPREIRAWGPGALRRRLLTLLPGQEIDDESRWIPTSDEYRAAQRNEAACRADAERQATSQATAVRTECEAMTADELEGRHGASLDALGPSERDELARSKFGDGPLWRLYVAGGRALSGIVRSKLLAALGHQEGAT